MSFGPETSPFEETTEQVEPPGAPLSSLLEQKSPFEQELEGEPVQVAGLFSNLKHLRGLRKAEVKPPAQPEKELFVEAEQQQVIQSLDPNTQTPTNLMADRPDVRGEAEQLLNAELQQFDLDATHQPNFDVIETTDEVKEVIAETAERNQGKINEARRGKITDEQLQGLARDLDVEVDVIRPILEREAGGTLNAETILAARQVLNSSAERVLSLAKQVSAGQGSPQIQLQFRRQMEFHKEYMSGFMGARAEAGRSLRAFGIPVGSDETQIQRMHEMVETMHGRDINRVANALAKIDSIQGMNKAVNRYTKSKVRGVLEELFINSILSGIKTHVVNTSGNALFQVMNIAETAVASQIGRLFNDAERTQLGEASAMLYGMFGGFNDGMRMFAKTLRTGESSSVKKFETPYPKAISSENLEIAGPLGRAIDMVGSVIRFPTERMLAAEDDLFKTTAYRANLYREGYRRAMQAREAQGLNDQQTAEMIKDFVENPPEDMVMQSDDFALYSTFQNPLGTHGRQIQSLANQVPGLKVIVPFIRTPTNLFKGAFVDRTPLGLFSKRIREDIAAGGSRRDLALARVSMGAVTATSIAMAVTGGVITGGGPSNPQARQLMEATGWRPYSIRYIDSTTGKVKYKSYARAEPLAFIVGATADAVEMLEWMDVDPELDSPGEQANTILAAIVGGIAENTMSKTFLSGLSRFSEAVMTDPERYLSSYLKSMGGAFIPYSALRRDISKITDPQIREAWSMLNKVKATSGIPGFSEEAPPSRDMFGTVRYHPRGSWLGVVTPFPDGEETTDPVRLEVRRLMKQTGRVPLTRPRRRIEGERLSEWEYHDYLNFSRNEITDNEGRTFNEALSDLVEGVRSDVYETSTDDARVTLIKQLQRDFDEAARVELERAHPNLADRLLRRRAVGIERRHGEEAADQFMLEVPNNGL